MLKSTYTQQSVATSYEWPDSWYGVPHEDIPVVSPNPYANNYSYADNAYFGQLSSSDLEEIFSTILKNSTTEKPYGFVLYQNTSVLVTDYIGAGMEIKGTPVLRYAGQNYTNPTVSTSGNTTTYTYHGTYQDPYIPNREPVDISDIIVTVTSEPHVPIYMCGIEAHTHDAECAQEYSGNCPIVEHTHSEEACGIYWSYLCGHHAHRPDLCYTDGVLSCDDPHVHTDSCVKITQTQQIQLSVPDSALPVYTPELIGQQYYYEALPVRLIYQVGLTNQAADAVLDLATNGGELTFYTNRWGGAQHARSDLLPSLVNPFYYDQDTEDEQTDVPYHEHNTSKGSNTTQTSDYSVECHWGALEYENQHLGHVYHELGNNGKLVFEAETIEIPVEKQWVNVNTDSMDPVDVTLYKVVETGTEGGGTTQTVIKVATAQLNTSNSWKHTFQVPAPGENWYYAIVEAVDDKYIVTYSGETVSINIGENGEPVTAAKVTFEENSNAILTTITNAPAIELPKTGGMGTAHYTAAGMFLMAAAVLLLLQKSRIKRGGRTSF